MKNIGNIPVLTQAKQVLFEANRRMMAGKIDLAHFTLRQLPVY
jgi:hypothetical protein